VNIWGNSQFLAISLLLLGGAPSHSLVYHLHEV
jgi:hypothetical protein